MGHAGAALRRTAPHSVGTGFLPAVGQPREFPAGRHSLTADALVELAEMGCHVYRPGEKLAGIAAFNRLREKLREIDKRLREHQL